VKYFLKSRGGRSFEIEVTEAGAGLWRVRCGGREIAADFRDVDRLGQYAVLLDGRSYAASIEESDGQRLRVNIAGAAFALEALDERERAAGELVKDRPARAAAVVAPMPGILVAVRVRPGERVAAGLAVAVLAAMKMQNELAPERDGVVEEICAEAGKPVDAGQTIVRLRPA
jgi:biotin carboxyl carrier protein